MSQKLFKILIETILLLFANTLSQIQWRVERKGVDV